MSMATQMVPQVRQLTVQLTPDQMAFLVDVVDNISIAGKHAAMLVSIQQALASATPDALQSRTDVSDTDTLG